MPQDPELISFCQDHEFHGYVPKSACEICGCRARLKQELDKLEQLEEGYFHNTSDEERRLRLMEQGDPTWDLSFNDRCAIAWVLDALKFTRVKLAEAMKRAEKAEQELASFREKVRAQINALKNGGGTGHVIVALEEAMK